MKIALIFTSMCLMLSMVSSVSEAKTTCHVDIGSPLDELLIREGWFGAEGPYEQFGEICKSRFRWTSQGAKVRIPVFPGVTNTVQIRCDFGHTEGQKLFCFVNGIRVCEVPHHADGNLIYQFDVQPDVIGDKVWGELRLETVHNGPVGQGDGRDLRVAVDWIKVTAAAPERNFVSEALLEVGSKFSSILIDKAPDHWRMRYDPINCGESTAPMSFTDMMYDDSGFETVPADYVPPMRRGDAAWYRTWFIIANNGDHVRSNLKLPGDSFDKDGRRTVWVNNTVITGSTPDELRANASKALADGGNLVIVKVMKGPLPKVTGDSIVEKPVYSENRTPGNVTFKLDKLVLTPAFSSSKKLNVKLISPGKKVVGSVKMPVIDLGGGKMGANLRAAWMLKEYGEHSLIIDDGAGHQQRFPVHFLGINFFHWGWYTGGGGTSWNGFSPTSNDYLDQLFSKLDDWGSPHHSITWGGAILEPGTGFHLTKGTDYIAKYRESISDGKLGFVGAPFPPRNVCTDFGESLLRSMRKSLDLYQSQLGVRPHQFVSHDATLNPLLPQIMQMSGYDTYCVSENWWGQQQSIPNSRDCYWESPDGTKVRIMDSWYHGLPAINQAHRAVELGKPAVLCNEEFACLDRTVFLNESDIKSLLGDGIFLQPVSLDEYQKITEKYAAQYTYKGDDYLCYKGWTGGSEGEFEYEKANRQLETKLVALENMIAFARWKGITVDQKPIDELWNLSMRAHECHLHWGNGYPDLTAQMLAGASFVDSEMRRLASLIGAEIKSDDKGVAVFNPIGMKRRGLVSIDTPDDVKAITASGKVYPLQPDPDKPGTMIASLPDLPSCGYRKYSFTDVDTTNNMVKAVRKGSSVVLDNGVVAITVNSDASVASIVDKATGKSWFTRAHKIFLAKPHDKVDADKLSSEAIPLNLDFYTRPLSSGAPKIICQGPVLSVVECELSAPEYPMLSLKVRFSLAAGEHQARVRFFMDFREPAVIWAKDSPGPHEGTYIPGIFVMFPMPDSAKPMADMAYCTTDGVLTSTNHETFMRMPFRHGTFNTLSMAGPNSGEYCVLTRGLPDFFVIRKPSSYMGMSLGMGPAAHPYHNNYVYEYAVSVPESADVYGSGMNFRYYKDAQSFLIDPVSVEHSAGTGDLPSEGSFVGADAESVIIPGMQMIGDKLLIRVLQLDNKPVTAGIKSMPSLDGASVSPSGSLSGSKLKLAPKAVREISIPVHVK
ncbi:MAG: alpha-mannosidase [Armatimonadota bacterium]